MNDFIDRAMEAERVKLSKLKTERGKQNEYERFVCALVAAFDCAHTFWTGNNSYPHYTGPLFTDKNYKIAEAIWDSKY